MTASRNLELVASPAYDAERVIEVVLSGIAGHGDARMRQYWALLEPLLSVGSDAVRDLLDNGEISPANLKAMGEAAWRAMHEVPIDLIDELNVLFVVAVAESHLGEPVVVEAAERTTIAWYEGFWPFEHPEAVAQAIRFGSLAHHLPAPAFMANSRQRITFTSEQLNHLLETADGTLERLTMTELFGCDLEVGADRSNPLEIRVGNQVRHLDLVITPVETDEGIEYFGFIRDRTKEVALEQMRNGVVGAISHELRTPLTAMIGYLELITSGALPPADHPEALAIVKSESKLLLRLVTDIVDFSKLTAGTATLDMQRVDVAEELTAATRRALHGSDKTLVVDMPHGFHIMADRDRFGQLLTNLLTNAVRYGGTTITVSGRRDCEFDIVAVADDGEGIDESEIDSIFDPFVQGQRRHTGDGAGLGLAICNGIMTSVGGTLRVENRGGAYFVASFVRQ